MKIKQTVKTVLGEDNWRNFVQIKDYKNNGYVKSLLDLGRQRSSTFQLNNFIEEVNNYVDLLRLEEFQYRFSEISTEPTLYSSVYACMIKGLFNKIEESEKSGWKDYFDSFQRDDGLFVDSACYNEKYDEGEGWGARHLQGHIIIAYQRLGYTPKKEFTFLNHLLDPDAMIKWLDSLDYKAVWGSSNAIMNYGVSLQYARDFMGMKAEMSIEAMQDWLIKHIRRDCGMWFDGDINSKTARYEAIRGAYHIYPILKYDGIEIPYANEALDLIINMQNKWGGFDYKICSSACADIDAIDPLLRLALQTNEDRSKVEPVVQKALDWIFVNQNNDGGFVFDHQQAFSYGNEVQLSSEWHQSNMFATWFRVLSILYMQEYLGNHDVDFVKVPGYEYPLEI